MEGPLCQHSLVRLSKYPITRWAVFKELFEARVVLEGMILKPNMVPNMVIDGKGARKAGVEEMAEKTVRVLKQTVPAAVLKNCFSCLAGNLMKRQRCICLP